MAGNDALSEQHSLYCVLLPYGTLRRFGLIRMPTRKTQGIFMIPLVTVGRACEPTNRYGQADPGTDRAIILLFFPLRPTLRAGRFSVH